MPWNTITSFWFNNLFSEKKCICIYRLLVYRRHINRNPSSWKNFTGEEKSSIFHKEEKVDKHLIPCILTLLFCCTFSIECIVANKVFTFLNYSPTKKDTVHCNLVYVYILHIYLKKWKFLPRTFFLIIYKTLWYFHSILFISFFSNAGNDLKVGQLQVDKKL